MMQRTGECNLCGQCCGAAGSPNQDSPWPDTWPEAIRSWSPISLMQGWPMVDLIPIAVRKGVATVEGKKYPYEWVPGESLCKAVGDVECPFLIEGDDGTRPCALVGTEYEYIWRQLCKPGHPPERIWAPGEVKEWFENHPACSFEYVEE